MKSKAKLHSGPPLAVISSLFSKLPVLYLCLDSEGKILSYTGIFADKIQNIISKLKKKPLLSDVFNVDEKARQKLSQVTRKNEAVFTCTLQSGNKTHHLHLYCYLDKNQTTIHAFGSDITDRVAIEASAERLRRHWLAIVESSPDHLILTDKSGKILFINHPGPGLKIEEIVGKTVFDFTPSEYCSVMQSAFEKLHETGKPQDYEVRYFHPNVGMRRFECRVGLVPDDGSGVVQVIRATDVTERSRNEILLQEIESYNRMLFEESTAGLALCRLDGTLVDVNEAYCRIIGYTREEVLKLTYWDVTPKKYEAEEAKQLKLLNDTGRYGPYEKEYKHKDGHLVPVRLSGLILKRNNEKYIWSSVEDITEQKKAGLELLNARRELEKRVAERTAELKELNEQLLSRMNEQAKTEKELETKNLAMREMLTQLESEKKMLEKRMISNIETSVLPILSRLQNYLGEEGQSYMSLVRENLSKVTSGYGDTILRKYRQLTPREIEVCNLIKSGLKTKEIANLMKCSRLTVDTHRTHIREKLGIAGREVNLRAFLHSIEHH